MKLRQHTIHTNVKPFIETKNPLVYKNYLPAAMYKQAQVGIVLEQNINESVSILKEMKDYIVCQIKSTIQHEGAHRSDEEQRHSQDPEKRIKFEDFSNPTRAEPIAERAEEMCVAPKVISGETEQISINDLFEQAKSKASIDSSWRNDVVAATLASGIAGEYLAKDIPIDEVFNAQQVSQNVYKMGNKLFIDVRKIVAPFITKATSYSPVVQTKNDGAVTTDPDILKQQNTHNNGGGVIPSTPSVPSFPSI